MYWKAPTGVAVEVDVETVVVGTASLVHAEVPEPAAAISSKVSQQGRQNAPWQSKEWRTEQARLASHSACANSAEYTASVQCPRQASLPTRGPSS